MRTKKDSSQTEVVADFSAVDDARRVAAALDIPYYVMNFKNEFKSSVIDYFIEEYKKGGPPTLV